jgi:formylmethanofuran dehydrogenase subunit E
LLAKQDFKEAEARTQARLESQLAARCNKCGEAIMYKMQYVQVGSDAYHPACWQG